MLRHTLLTIFTCGCFLSPLMAEKDETMKIAVANFKNCVDQSKLGQEEQSHFEALRKQMENALQEKEKVLTEMSSKLEDPDYLDSISPETETELKRKFRNLSQELNQIQAQYYQTLSQANMKIIQELQEAVVAASKIVAKEKNIDMIVNEESAFFYNQQYDISNEIIAAMNKNYEQNQEEAKE